MITTHKEVRALLDPWPIAMSKGRYRWTVSTVAKCKKLKSFWDPDYKMSAVARQLRERWPSRHHHVSAIEMSGPGLPFIIVERGMVVDGNHRLLAMIRMKYKGPIIRVDHIRGSGKGDENIPKLKRAWNKKKVRAWS